MSLWDYKFLLDDLVYEINNVRLRCLSRSIYFRSRVKISEVSFDSDTVELVLNGPSSASYKHDGISAAVFVNFGFRHEEFSKAKHPYLLIVDQKFADGLWPLTMLDEARKANPNVRFVLNYHFLKSAGFYGKVKRFDPLFVDNNLVPTVFSRDTSIRKGASSIGGAVAEQAISMIVAGGVKRIDVYGLDGNNVCLGLLGLDTHFYGVDPDKKWDDSDFVFRELFFLSQFIQRHIRLSIAASKRNVKVVNRSDNSIMKMYSNE